MAGDWIKMRADLYEDPAVITMAARLGIDEFAVVGRLHRFWSWLDRQSRDGHATGVTHSWLDRHVHCEGFAAAMVSVRWLELGTDGLSVPNFDRHNGETAKSRALTTNRKRRQRSGDVTPPSRSERDNSVTREEKRREEEKENARAADAPPDFERAALLVSKLEGVGFKIDPDPQLVVAWMSRYGYDLILETVHDVAAECLGKHFRYFEAILQSRSENPNERPGNRRKRTDGRRAAPEVGGAETRPPSGPRAVDFGHRTIDDILGKVPAVPGSTPGGSTGNLPGV